MPEENTNTQTQETQTAEETTSTSEEESDNTGSTKKTSVWKRIVTVVWQAIIAAITAWTASSCCNTLID